ncbi:hypothetical protein [uncultured Mediterranean phage]|nr:hypothetical protein [uncultured Mediterranean phage]
MISGLMSSGIFDRLLFFVDKKSPLRSDRAMGFYTTMAAVVATACGLDWSAANDAQAVNYMSELFTGVSGIVTSFSGLVMLLGQMRRDFSDREF